MFQYRYHFKLKHLRDFIDLSEHKYAIENGLREVFPNVNNINVHKNLFEFDLPETATNAAKRMMGKRIITKSGSLSSLVQEYIYKNRSDGSNGRSGQLFVAKKN